MSGDRRRSVVDGRLERCSASQVKTFRKCQQKWVFEKIVGLPKKPPGKGVLLGLKGHKQIEHFITTGEDVRDDLARLSQPLLARLLSSTVEVEAPVSVSTSAGVEVNGFVDMVVHPGHDLSAEPGWHWTDSVDGAYLSPSLLPVVVDHKFRANVEKYAESAESLATDEQAVIYGHAVQQRFDARAVVFRHHNHQTQGRRFAQAETVVLSKEHLDEQWVELADFVDGPMQEAARSNGASALYNESACGAFGGCDFAEQCPMSPTNRFMSSLRLPSAPVQPHTQVDPMSLADRLKQAMGSNAEAIPTQPVPVLVAPPVAVAAPPAPVVVPPTAPAPGSITASLALPGGLYYIPGSGVMKCEGLLPTGAFFTSSSGAPKMVALSTAITDHTQDEVARANYKLPPLIAPVPVEAPAAPPAPARRMLIAEPAFTPPDMPASAPVAQFVAPVVVAPAAEAPAAPAVEPTKEKRTRAKKEPQVTGTATVPSTDGLTLLVNCSTSNARDLASWVLELEQRTADAAGVPDVRLAPNEHVLAYGRWKAVLAKAALKDPPTGVCTIRTGELADPIIEALSGIASTVIR